ncbi:MAG: nitronate monooxygenase [Burkholderiaceae bacterium]|nr:nitronate monooxygenase [Burkholderiaceae bacterium]
MNSIELCRRLKIDFPVFAFTHCRDVVVEVTNAGGVGVLGSIKLSPEELDMELSWIDERVGGKPYGVDLIVPGAMQGREEDPDADAVLGQLPDRHKEFAAGVLASRNIDASVIDDETRKESLYFSNNARLSGADRLLDVVFRHPVALVANALGVPPAQMVKRGKENGVLVAALVGTAEHAVRQARAGVDLIIAAGGEAGGHCGEIGTMVLIPEVSAALKAHPQTTLLAAGGIVTGQQMAAALCMGAAGVWCGSVWLTTTEAETPPVVKDKMLSARSSDTVRSRSRTGKFSRQLRSAWTDAWEAGGGADAAAHAIADRAGHALPQPRRQARRGRPRRGQGAQHLLRRSGRRHDERIPDRARDDAGLPGGFPRGLGAAGRVHRDRNMRGVVNDH